VATVMTPQTVSPAAFRTMFHAARAGDGGQLLFASEAVVKVGGRGALAPTRRAGCRASRRGGAAYVGHGMPQARLPSGHELTLPAAQSMLQPCVPGLPSGQLRVQLDPASQTTPQL